MKSRTLQWTAIILILVTGYLHFVTAPSEYVEMRYMGVLFLLNFLGSLVAAVGIIRQSLWWGWAPGILIAAGSIIGYLQSRTIGLPGMDVEEWFSPIGLSAVCVEGLFLIVFVLSKPWIAADPRESLLPASNRQPYYLTLGILAVIVLSSVSYQLGVRGGSDHGEEHELPVHVISAQTLEEEYGIQVTLVAVTAAGGMVDVRYRVIDPEKAVKLVNPDDGGIMPMIFVSGTDTMLMPDMHMRTQQLTADRTYFTLIPNTQNAVQRGSFVTVAFENVALEPVIAK